MEIRCNTLNYHHTEDNYCAASAATRRQPRGEKCWMRW